MSEPHWKRPILDLHAAARDEARRYGATVGELMPGGKHPQAWLEWQGHRHKLVFPGSPRRGGEDARTQTVRSVRHALRRFGVMIGNLP